MSNEAKQFDQNIFDRAELALRSIAGQAGLDAVVSLLVAAQYVLEVLAREKQLSPPPGDIDERADAISALIMNGGPQLLQHVLLRTSFVIHAEMKRHNPGERHSGSA